MWVELIMWVGFIMNGILFLSVSAISAVSIIPPFLLAQSEQVLGEIPL